MQSFFIYSDLMTCVLILSSSLNNIEDFTVDLIAFVMHMFFTIWLISPLRVSKCTIWKITKNRACFNLCQEEEKEGWKRERASQNKARSHHLHNTSSKNLSKETPSRSAFSLWINLIKSTEPMENDKSTVLNWQLSNLESSKNLIFFSKLKQQQLK